jgi:PAS domain S-box-containing protein
MLLVIISVGATTAFYSISMGKQTFFDSFNEDAKNISNMISRSISDDLYFLDVHAMRNHLDGLEANPEILFVMVMDTTRRLIIKMGKIKLAESEQFLNFKSIIFTKKQYFSFADKSVFFVGQPIISSDGTNLGYLFVSFSLEKAYGVQNQTTRNILIITFFILLLASIIVYYFSSMIGDLISDLVKVANNIGKGEFKANIKTNRTDELGDLIIAIDQMAINLRETTVSKKYTDNIIQSMPNALFVVKKNGHVERINTAALRLTGYSENDIVDYPIIKLFPKYPIMDFLENRPNEDIETVVLTKDNHEISVAIFASHLYDSDELMAYICIVRDITEKKKYEEIIQKSELRYNTLFNLLPYGGEVLDRNGVIINCSPNSAKMLGYKTEEMLGHSIVDFVEEKSRPIFKKTWPSIIKGEPQNAEIIMVGRRGERHNILRAAQPIIDKNNEIVAVLTLNVDISEQKRAEKEKLELEHQISRIQKLESIGKLSGGIAHDFNNILTAILGYCELSLNKIDEKNPIYSNLREIQKGSERASNLTKQLLAFSRKQMIRPKIVNINDVVENMEDMLRKMIGEDINLDFHLKKSIPLIKADSNQLEQILMNLILNSRDALNELTGDDIQKMIIIETNPQYLDKNFLQTHIESIEGPHVVLTVTDNGIGMTEQVAEKIFEPFYTTKAVDRGTGLGMATVYGIVKQNSGSIYVYSEPNIGTTIKIFWPYDESITEKIQQKVIPEATIHGTGKILLVEDDPEVRQFAKDALVFLGYDVSEARNGFEALELLQNQHFSFDMVLSDVVMPGIGGAELYQKMIELHIDMPILFSSGYTDKKIIIKGLAEEDFNFLAKPYTIQMLSEKIWQVIGEKNS